MPVVRWGPVPSIDLRNCSVLNGRSCGGGCVCEVRGEVCLIKFLSFLWAKMSYTCKQSASPTKIKHRKFPKQNTQTQNLEKHWHCTLVHVHVRCTTVCTCTYPPWRNVSLQWHQAGKISLLHYHYYTLMREFRGIQLNYSLLRWALPGVWWSW